VSIIYYIFRKLSMSDRFYFQMRQATGWCPGLPESYKKRRKRMSTWTDETKQEAIDMYVAEEPTPENSMEIVKSIAEQLDQSPNGVRMILTKAGVYVKKNPAVKSSGGGTGGGRVSVAAAQEELTNAISDMGQEPDAAIIGKLTGKAAKYFADLLNKLND
jgi:transposase-like protein